ncbi:hypothetical protein P0D88_40720 [Paraburkholderia sp. RL18-103-BIB-C]|jgi:hypothetical protein|uniref:hypothetical protein n=1 Tax=unclassified Paraburkholderia TaxID=2615204 RepID=UPI0038BBDF1C
MHREYGYKGFHIEVDTEPIGRLSNEKVVFMAAGYVAVVRISTDASPATIHSLRFGRDDGSPFPTEAETLMSGYSAAQRLIDGWQT